MKRGADLPRIQSVAVRIALVREIVISPRYKREQSNFPCVLQKFLTFPIASRA